MPCAASLLALAVAAISREHDRAFDQLTDGEDDMWRQQCDRGAPDEAALGVAGMRHDVAGSTTASVTNASPNAAIP
jgi:hypothetical protein